ncbi:late control protein [Lysinibacillus capsici]|uniref:phage late control D family protein n=1 Tax=Lysinibacillus capsici TaxID=2115968 RepID=UPI002E22514E|nr:late control protein [Lysinibacillus capsici]
MTNTRRAIVVISYNGKNITADLAPDLTSFQYNDNEGKSDEIQLDLQDREKKWQDPWLPGKGDKIHATIRLENWRKEKEVSQLKCGTFYIDDVSFKGPPDKVSIKAVSTPFNEGGKDTEKTKAWENTDLKTILTDVAKSAGLKLFFDAPNHKYKRVEQSKKTDLAFAKEITKKEGLSIKVTNDQLIVYDELEYEKKSAVRTITRGEDDIKSYDFKETAAEEQYAKVEISYSDATKKKTIKYTYNVPGVKSGPTLKVNKKAKNLDEAKRWAQAEARNKNKRSKTGKITLLGDERLVQGLTIELKKFGAFSGKYIIESAGHNVTGGYTTDINLRGVLSY